MSWQNWIQTSQTSAPVLPTRRDEEWKYVSLKFLENWDFKPALREKASVGKLNADFTEIVMIDGYLSSDLPEGLKVEVIRRDEEPSQEFQKWFEHFESEKKRIEAGRDLFEDLNGLRFQEGLFIDVPTGFASQKPLAVRWVTTSSLGTRYPRVWLRVGKRSKLVMAEIFESTSEVEALLLPVFEIELEETAKLELTRVVKSALGNAQIARSRVIQRKDSNFESLSMALGSKLVRHNLDLYLCEEGATSRAHGLSYTGGAQVVDHHTRIDHVVGHCQTSQLYKSVLAGTSRSVFNGQVVIRHDAQKASSEQLNQNLLLSSQAEVDSKPELMIYADDVKATHGSTIGQLNDEEVFYFLSRGISRSVAEAMIRRGFTQDLLMQVSNDEVRNWILSLQVEADQRLMV